MSPRASSGSAYALTTAPGTARLIFSGHDGSASGDSSRIVKLIAQLQLVQPQVRGCCEGEATTPPNASTEPATPDPNRRCAARGVGVDRSTLYPLWQSSPASVGRKSAAHSAFLPRPSILLSCRPSPQSSSGWNVL